MAFKNYLITLGSYLNSKGKRKLIKYAAGFRHLEGIEIGGPSSFFGLKSYLPVYIFARNIDGVNYSAETVWEGAIKEGDTFNYFGQQNGYQFIREATDLSGIPNEKYDFVLSCHCLEHTANPIKALKEWCRILKPEGRLALILPDKQFTFDHKRPYTTINHLISDYENNTGEGDSTHFEEVLLLHDMEQDRGINSSAELNLRTQDNFINRCVHQHIFSFELISEMLDFSGFKTIYQQKAAPFHLITLAQKK